jgi:hypothetical protein
MHDVSTGGVIKSKMAQFTAFYEGWHVLVLRIHTQIKPLTGKFQPTHENDLKSLRNYHRFSLFISFVLTAYV